jgi:TP901 family phage tail tape measure protein
MDLAVLGVKIDPTAAKAGGRQAEDAFERMKAKAKSSLDTIDRHVNALRSTMFNVQNAVIALGATFAATQGIRVFAGFEREMSNVKALTNATEQEMAELTMAARELGATTEFTARQAGEAMRYLGQAGFSTNQILAATPAALDLAMAASIDLGRAAGVTANIMAAFGKDASKTREIVDVLAVAASSSQTDIQQLADAMKYAGPVASSLGISINDAAAAMGVLSNNGLQGSMAGTGLRRVLSELADPSREAEIAIQSLGLTLQDLNPQTNSVLEIISRLALAGLDAGKAFTIFGDRGAPAILALTRSVPKLAELTAKMQDTTGAAKRMSDTMHDNLIGDFRTLISVVEEVAIRFGTNGLGGSLRSIVQETTAVIQAFAGMSDPLDEANRGAYEMVENLKLLGAVAAGFVAAKLAFHLISIGTAAVQAAIAMRSLNLIIAANPIGIIATGIGLATAALIAHSTQTTEAERKQKAYNETLEKHRKLMDDGAEAGEAALKRSMMDLRQRGIQAHLEIQSLEEKIGIQKKLAAVEKERVDAESIADERNRRVHRRPERDKLSALESELAATKKAYAEIVKAREQAGAQLEDLQMEQLAREAGISEKIEAEYQSLRQKTIERWQGQPEKLQRALDALDARFKRIKENAPIDNEGLSKLEEFVRTLDIGSSKAQNLSLFTGNLEQAIKKLGLSQEEANEALIMARYSLTATPIQRYADGLDVASSHTRLLTRETELMDLALKKNLITQEEYNEVLNELKRALSRGGPLQQYVDSLDIAESRVKAIRIEQQKLNEALKSGVISISGYDEAMRALNDALRTSQSLMMRTNDSLIQDIANERVLSDEKGRIRDELNRRIERGDVTQTEAFKAGVADQIATWGNAQQRMMELGRGTAQALENDFGTFFDALIDDIGSAGDAFKNLVSSILKDMARLIAQEQLTKPLLSALFAGFGGIGGKSPIPASAGFGDGVSAGASVGLAHTGGVIGRDALAARNVSMDIFRGAPRFHGGGIAGDEVPIIAKRGEGVFTPEQMKALGSAGGNQISVQNTIIVNRDGTTKQKSTATGMEDPAMARKLAEFIDNRTRQTVIAMAAPGGPLYQSRV